MSMKKTLLLGAMSFNLLAGGTALALNADNAFRAHEKAEHYKNHAALQQQQGHAEDAADTRIEANLLYRKRNISAGLAFVSLLPTLLGGAGLAGAALATRKKREQQAPAF